MSRKSHTSVATIAQPLAFMSPVVNGVFRLPGGAFRGVGTVGVPVTVDLCSNNDVCPHSTVDNVCIFIDVLSVCYMGYYLLRASYKIVYFSPRHLIHANTH